MTAPTRSHLLALLTAAAVTTGLLAGCTGGTPAPRPTTAITDSATATPTTSATPSAAEAPQWTSAMDQVGLDGALAVGQYFLELFPYVIETGDTTEWRRLSHPDCTFCSEVAASVSETPAPRDAVQMNVSSASVQEIQPGALFKGTYSITEVSSDGSTEAVTAYAAIVNDAGRWQIRGVQFEPAAGADG